MKLGKLVVIKDKQFFTNELRIIGNPITYAKRIKGNYDFLHIIDKDLSLSNMPLKNFDIYDKLTYIINIQVEVPKGFDSQVDINRLFSINARVVIPLPSFESFLSKVKNEKLLVAYVDRASPQLKFFRDVVVPLDKWDVLKKDPVFLDKRVFTIGCDPKLSVYGCIRVEDF